MNDSKNSSNGLLVLRFPQFLSQEDTDKIIRAVTPTAEALGVEPMVLGNGADARVEADYTSLLTRLCVAVERLVAQGEPPAVSEEIAPPALNQRPTGLNSRSGITCKGSWQLGTACGKCSRCEKNRPSPPFAGIDPNFNPQLKDTL